MPAVMLLPWLNYRIQYHLQPLVLGLAAVKEGTSQLQPARLLQVSGSVLQLRCLPEYLQDVKNMHKEIMVSHMYLVMLAS